MVNYDKTRMYLYRCRGEQNETLLMKKKEFFPRYDKRTVHKKKETTDIHIYVPATLYSFLPKTISANELYTARLFPI